ncbi:hypothetical protein ABW387_18000 [Snodgrassella alvi]|uniref:hypothetical protein n=1 Tax=Snodgrassella alvi TaxID=1196083 RepID=UPI00351124BD
MKKYILEPYVAFDPDTATYLFTKNIKLEENQSPAPQISREIFKIYFPKKIFSGGVIIYIIYIACFYLQKFFLEENTIPRTVIESIQILAVIFLLISIAQIVGIIREIRRLKKLYQEINWPAEYHYVFFEEGILIKSVDMEGIFYWDDFMSIILTSNTLAFNLCPAGTQKGNIFIKHYPRLHNFYLFTDIDEQIKTLITSISQRYKKLVVFR